ncbi:hypothetical protein SUGI_0383890 [Cryptomeria japonica]|nr:hypothetical protein SUGI_0383890 [Cryptomeria japonica]
MKPLLPTPAQVVAFLIMFGNGQTPVLNLAGHCDPPSGGCKLLSTQIESFHSSGVKVFLSLGGSVKNVMITSAEDVQEVANYLGGNLGSKPLRPAILDDIDFDIESMTVHWNNLAKAVSKLSTNSKKVYLSATPQCPYPDTSLGDALQTGLFDYVWIQFYNNPPYQYVNEDASNLVNSWNHWTTFVPMAQTWSFYLGLPAMPRAIGSSYIEPHVLIEKVLPKIKPSLKYGEVMLWSKYWDEKTNYSSTIKDSIIMKPSLVELPTLAFL